MRVLVVVQAVNNDKVLEWLDGDVIQPVIRAEKSD
jgi:hypothetical protein